MNPVPVVDSYPEYHLHQLSLESYLQGIFVGSTIKVEVSTQGLNGFTALLKVMPTFRISHTESVTEEENGLQLDHTTMAHQRKSAFRFDMCMPKLEN
jgi:hypothetical protein